jgi:hypothetical protein
MAAYGGVTLRKVIPPVEMEDDDLMSEEFERQAKIASQAAEEEEPEYEEEEEDLSRYMSKDNASPPKNKDDMKRALAESRKCGKVCAGAAGASPSAKKEGGRSGAGFGSARKVGGKVRRTDEEKDEEDSSASSASEEEVPPKKPKSPAAAAKDESKKNGVKAAAKMTKNLVKSPYNTAVAALGKTSTKFLTSKNSYTNMVAAYNLHAGEFQTKHDMDCKDVSLALVASMENRDEILDAYIAISQELLARWRLKGLTENLYKEVKTLKADAAKLLEQQGAAAIEAVGDDMD